jgi:hypothetical protein
MTAYRRECNMRGAAAALTFIHFCDSFSSGARGRQTGEQRFSTDGEAWCKVGGD